MVYKTEQVRDEVKFFHSWTVKVILPIDSMLFESEANIAGHVLGTLVSLTEKVELMCPHILPEFHHMVCQTFKPWMLMMEILTTVDSGRMLMEDFPIFINEEVLSNNDLFWTKAVDVKLTKILPELSFFRPMLPAMCDAIKAREILRHAELWSTKTDGGLFELFEANYNTDVTRDIGPRERPIDSLDSHRVYFKIKTMFEDVSQFGIMASFASAKLKQIESLPVPKLQDVTNLIRPKHEWLSHEIGAHTMKRVMEPILQHLKVKTGTFLRVLRNRKSANEKPFEEYINAVTSFYLGQSGDVLSDIAHIVSDGLNGTSSCHHTLLMLLF